MSSTKIINFSAGPSKIPEEVKDVMYKEFMDYNKTGSSIFELSHRSEPFIKIVESTKGTLKALLSIPDNYEILLLQGGATGQFSGIPLNLLGGDSSRARADYFVTGQWSAKAAKEATKYGHVNLVTPLKNVGLAAILPGDQGDAREIDASLQTYLSGKVDPEASYFYYCSNETIDGFEVNDHIDPHGANFLDTLESAYYDKWASSTPDSSDGSDFVMPLVVCDMSSNFCTKPIDVSRFALIYGGAQKNIGIAGVTVVVIRRDLIGKFESPYCPSVLSYKVVAAANSLPNTPPVYSIYALNLTLKWTLTCPIVSQGATQNGLSPSKAGKTLCTNMIPWHAYSSQKSRLIYAIIDSSLGFYAPLTPLPHTPLHYRSRINIPFRVMDRTEGIPSDVLEKAFVDEAKAHGLLYLKGHRTVGGLRVSLFNSITLEETQRLAQFLQHFMDKHNTLDD